MAWVYYISSGQLYHHTKPHAKGYAGNGDDIDNPNSTGKKGKGPLPVGHYVIGRPVHHKRLGPVSMFLAPTTYDGDRGGFFIHGDNAKADRSASQGCIVLSRPVREKIAYSGDDDLLVVA